MTPHTLAAVTFALSLSVLCAALGLILDRKRAHDPAQNDACRTDCDAGVDQTIHGEVN